MLHVVDTVARRRSAWHRPSAVGAGRRGRAQRPTDGERGPGSGSRLPAAAKRLATCAPIAGEHDRGARPGTSRYKPRAPRRTLVREGDRDLARVERTGATATGCTACEA